MDEEKETPEEVPFAQAKEELMAILDNTPESAGTNECGIVAFSCIMDTATHEIDARGGFAGEPRSCEIAIAGLISQLAETTGIDAEQLAKEIVTIVADNEENDMEFKVSTEIVGSDNTTEEQE